MRTSFHHQPEAQHPKFFSYPQQRRPITPSFGGRAEFLCSDRVFPLMTRCGSESCIAAKEQVVKSL
jgi:hypothetical protein